MNLPLETERCTCAESLSGSRDIAPYQSGLPESGTAVEARRRSRKVGGPAPWLLVWLALPFSVLGASRVYAQTTEADVFVAPAILDFDDKRYDDALANLRRALEIEPNHVEALYYAGVVQMARGRAEEAIPVSETVKDET